METINVFEMLAAMKAEFEGLVSERNMIGARLIAIGNQVSGLQQSIGGLISYAETVPDPEGKYRDLLEEMRGLANSTTTTKLTDAIREVLRSAPSWMTAVQVRDALMRRGFSFAGYTSNPLSSIHTTLRRLKDEVAETRQGDDAVFMWKRQPSPRGRLSGPSGPHPLAGKKF